MKRSVGKLLIFPAFVVAVCCAVGGTGGAAEVEVAWEPSSVRPGDLAVLSARMRSAGYAELRFSIPKDPHLRIVSSEPGVVRLVDGAYVQEHRWVLQAVASGEVVWDHPRATVHRGGEVETLDLPPLSLRIERYPEADTSRAPEALPGATAARAGTLLDDWRAWMSGGVLIALVVWGTLKLRRRK